MATLRERLQAEADYDRTHGAPLTAALLDEALQRLTDLEVRAEAAANYTHGTFMETGPLRQLYDFLYPPPVER